jgi:predicted PurR-regulated permease PerM
VVLREDSGVSTSDPGLIPDWAQRVSRWSWAFVGATLAVGIAFVALSALSPLIVPLIIAAVAAVVCFPLVDRLETLGVPRRLAAFAISVLIVLVAVAMVVIVVVGVVGEADELSAQFDAAWTELDDSIDNTALADFIDDLNFDPASLGTPALQGAGAAIGSFLSSAAGAISGLVLALVLLYYLLDSGRLFVQRWVRSQPADSQEQIRRVLTYSATTLRANARGRTLLAAVQGVFITVVALVLGLPLPATIGIVNFVGAFVPYLGAFVGGAFAVMMALAEGGPVLALITLIAVAFMNVVLENLLEPRLIGSAIKLHPIAVLLVTVAGGVIAGLIGLVLAAPAFAIASFLWRELRPSIEGGEPAAASQVDTQLDPQD